MFEKEEYWKDWTSEEVFTDNKKHCLVNLHRYQNSFAVLENYAHDTQIQEILKGVDRSNSKAAIHSLEKAVYTSLTTDTQKKQTKRLKI